MQTLCNGSAGCLDGYGSAYKNGIFRQSAARKKNRRIFWSRSHFRVNIKKRQQAGKTVSSLPGPLSHYQRAITANPGIPLQSRRPVFLYLRLLCPVLRLFRRPSFPDCCKFFPYRCAHLHVSGYLFSVCG